MYGTLMKNIKHLVSKIDLLATVDFPCRKYSISWLPSIEGAFPSGKALEIWSILRGNAPKTYIHTYIHTTPLYISQNLIILLSPQILEFSFAICLLQTVQFFIVSFPILSSGLGLLPVLRHFCSYIFHLVYYVIAYPKWSSKDVFIYVCVYVITNPLPTGTYGEGAYTHRIPYVCVRKEATKPAWTLS